MENNKNKKEIEPCFGYCPHCGSENTTSLKQEPHYCNCGALYYAYVEHQCKCNNCGKTYKKQFDM